MGVSVSHMLTMLCGWVGAEEERARRDPAFFLRSLNPETRASLEEFYREFKEPVSEKERGERERERERRKEREGEGGREDGGT